jgi:anthraniloyl-CoA monooxygenase
MKTCACATRPTWTATNAGCARAAAAAAQARGRRRTRRRRAAADVHAIQVRGLTLKNRIAVSPMAQYSAVDGVAGDYHLAHLGARALGGAALVFAEMTCVSADARITPYCPGMYTPEHTQAWKRIVDFVHRHSDAAIALQLGHAGAKGSTRAMWDGIDKPLDKATGRWSPPRRSSTCKACRRSRAK